jgi:hypothetical protein
MILFKRLSAHCRLRGAAAAVGLAVSSVLCTLAANGAVAAAPRATAAHRVAQQRPPHGNPPHWGNGQWGHARPGMGHHYPSGPRALGPIPFLPSIARIRIQIGNDDVVLTHEFNLPRGEYRSGNFRVFLAFGVPGVPRALEPTLLPVLDGALEPAADAPAAALEFDRAARGTSANYTLLGPDQMAGVEIKIGEAAFKTALQPGGMAVLRVRQQFTKPAEEAGGARSLIVRLGTLKDQGPLTVSRIEIISTRGALQQAEATLCGENSDPHPLSVMLAPAAKAQPDIARVPAFLATRHPDEHLCIRWVE